MKIRTHRAVIISVPYRNGYKYMYCDDTWVQIPVLKKLQTDFKDIRDARRLVKIGVSVGVVYKNEIQKLIDNIYKLPGIGSLYFDTETQFNKEYADGLMASEQRFKLKSGSIVVGFDYGKTKALSGGRELIFVVPIKRGVWCLLNEKDIGYDYKHNYGFYKDVRELNDVAVSAVYEYHNGEWVVYKQTEKGLQLCKK